MPIKRIPGEMLEITEMKSKKKKTPSWAVFIPLEFLCPSQAMHSFGVIEGNADVRDMLAGGVFAISMHNFRIDLP